MIVSLKLVDTGFNLWRGLAIDRHLGMQSNSVTQVVADNFRIFIRGMDEPKPLQLPIAHPGNEIRPLFVNLCPERVFVTTSCTPKGYSWMALPGAWTSQCPYNLQSHTQGMKSDHYSCIRDLIRGWPYQGHGRANAPTIYNRTPRE